MCGIVAISGSDNIVPSLIRGLKKLEYRGYDSCGIYAIKKKQGILRKNIGEVGVVAENENFNSVIGHTAIAHTRWATHGGVTQLNAHPHLSNDGRFSVCHNGIFNNHVEIRDYLISQGFNFISETDTEVFVNLVQHEFYSSNNLAVAFTSASKKMTGSFAVVLLSTLEPDTIYAAKQNAPLLLGLSDRSIYLASDVNAFIEFTKTTKRIEDGEIVCIKSGFHRIWDALGNEVKDREILTIQWSPESAMKGGYEHFMLKEIFEQPLTLKTALGTDKILIEKVADEISRARRVFFCGIGTTYYVALVGSYLFSKYAGINIISHSSDESLELAHYSCEDHALFLSQSGETFDTKAALQKAKEHGARTSAIVNVMGSTIANMVDNNINQGSGPEISVVSTKAAISQMIILHLLALECGKINGFLTRDEAAKSLKELRSFANRLELLINEATGQVRELARKYLNPRANKVINDWLFIGRGIYYGVALEASLKMKEITYLHAEGMPAGFLKHGTLSMIDDRVVNLFFIPSKSEEHLYELTLHALQEVKARDGRCVGFAELDDHKLRKMLDYSVTIPSDLGCALPYFELILAQLFSYYSAIRLDRNIDKPRNLAKSVTVP